MKRIKIPAADFRAGTLQTSIGWIGVRFAQDTLASVVMGHPSRAAALKGLGVSTASGRGDVSLTAAEENLLHRLGDMLEGAEDDFRDVPLDLSHLGPFGQRVVEHCRRIARGKTLSYAELAAKAGSPRAARAVGNVMRTNRYPLVVPCHRVVGAGKTIGGFSAPTGLDLKKQLLAREGALPAIAVSK